MRKKIMSLFAIVIMIFVSTASYGFAEEKGKVIFIDMNRIQSWKYDEYSNLEK